VALRSLAVLATVLIAALSTGEAQALDRIQVAGLQVALQARGLYTGPVDGIPGPSTTLALRRFQRSVGLTPSGFAGRRTRWALGRLGHPLFGRRPLGLRKRGWDVSVLQFLLVRKGLLRSAPDGAYGHETERAVRRFQVLSGLPIDGAAGSATLAALRPYVRPRHRVQTGETLGTIAERYGVSVAALARVNGLDPSDVLPAAARLRIPRFRPERAAGTASSPAQRRAAEALAFWAGFYGVDRRLVGALAWMESGYQSHVVSRDGARGIMQVTPSTWTWVELALLRHRIPPTLEGNVQVGVAFLRHLLDRFAGNEELALAGYYQGPQSVRNRGVLPESRLYIADILALKNRL